MNEQLVDDNKKIFQMQLKVDSFKGYSCIKLKHEKEENLMKFGDNLRNLRKSKKLSQEDLAEKMNVSRKSVSKWETGTGFPETEKLINICDLFDCSMDELVKGKISIDSSSEKEVYDTFMNTFSKSISFAIMLILIGTTIFLTLLGFNEDNSILGVVVLLIFVVFAVPIFIVKGIEMENFKSKYPKLSNFYSEEEIDNCNNKFSKMIALEISIILIGVVVLMTIIALKIFNENSTFPVSILMCFVAVAVPLLVNTGIQKDKYDIEKYNRENSICSKEKLDKAGIYCGEIMMITTIIYLLISFIFNVWEISWIVYPIGGILCGIVSLLLKKEL